MTPWAREEAALQETAVQIGWTVEQVVAALNADEDLPEAAYLECPGCSETAGGWAGVKHLPPLCPSSAETDGVSPEASRGPREGGDDGAL